MATTTTPNMTLTLPGVGTEYGPAWATEINQDLSILDGHNHSPGSGVQINPTGLNINIDLPFNANNATNLRSVRYVAQSSVLSGGSDLNCSYSVGSNGELYWNDAVGHKVQITNNGNVNSGAGSISGLPSGTASVSFNSVSSTYVFQSATGVAGSIDGRNIILRNSSSGSYGITLSAPTLASNYTVTLPALPGAQSFVAIDSSGNMTASVAVSGGITGSNIATNTVANSNLAVMPANTIKGNNTGSSATPIDLTAAQVSAMLSISGVPNVTIYGAGTYTFTVPASRIKVTLTAGGGGSGGAGPGNGRVGGGGGGGTVFGYISGLTVGSTVTVVVGAGGAGGNSSQGGTGGTSSFGSFMGAYGGTGGGYASTQAGGGTGGGAYISDPSVYGFGTNGSNGFPQSNTYTYIAYGGASYWGGGSSYIGASIFQGAIGGGGAAQNGTSPGGSGSDGIAIIEW